MAFWLEPIPPFRLDLTVWALRRRAHNVVDRWDGEVYRRVVVLNHQVDEVTVVQVGGEAKPRLRVSLAGEPTGAAAREQITGLLARLLGLNIDLKPFYRLAATDPVLASLANRFRGLKPPRFPSVFEALVNAIACQQISLQAGIAVLNRLAVEFGASVQSAHGFPRPTDLAGRDPQRLRALGLSGQKSRALLGLAEAVRNGEVLEALAGLDDTEALRRLMQLRGVGRWSAEYVLLRGLGRIHVFPGDDVGARKRLAQWLGLAAPLDFEGVARILRQWRPFAGLVYFHLLLHGLADQGVLTGESGLA
jgi:DNA-3-methyladenine glycosylase II